MSAFFAPFLLIFAVLILILFLRNDFAPTLELALFRFDLNSASSSVGANSFLKISSLKSQPLFRIDSDTVIV